MLFQCSGKIDILGYCYNRKSTGQNFWVSGEGIAQSTFRKEFKGIDNPDHRFPCKLRNKDGKTANPSGMRNFVCLTLPAHTTRFAVSPFDSEGVLLRVMPIHRCIGSVRGDGGGVFVCGG